MSILRGGILGNYRNSTGAVTFRTRGITTVSSLKVVKPKNPRTDAQQTQRFAFRGLNKFLSKFKNLANFLVEYEGDWGTSFSTMQKHSNQAVTPQSPTVYLLEPQRVSFGGGNMEDIRDLVVSNPLSGRVNFDWNGVPIGTQDANDRVSLLVVPHSESIFASWQNAEILATASSIVNYPSAYVGQVVSCYAIISNADQTKKGTLQYVGDFTLI